MEAFEAARARAMVVVVVVVVPAAKEHEKMEVKEQDLPQQPGCPAISPTTIVKSFAEDAAGRDGGAEYLEV